MKDIDLRAFNEVRELKKNFNDSLIKKRFKEKTRTFLFERLSGEENFKQISFEAMCGTLLHLTVKLSVNNAQTFYIKFNSVTVFKENISENFKISLDLELEKNNTLEFYSNGVIFVDAKLRGFIDIQELDNLEINQQNSTIHLFRDMGGSCYYQKYENSETLLNEFVLDRSNKIENYLSSASLITASNDLVQKADVGLVCGTDTTGYFLTSMNDNSNTRHNLDVLGSNITLLPILNNSYKFAIVTNRGKSFFISYFNYDYDKIIENEVLYDLKYDIKYIGNFEYLDETEFLHYGFWFTDKNNDAYLVLAINGTDEQVIFHTSPLYLGKASRVKVYVNGNKFTAYLSFDNELTLLKLNITHDSYSFIMSRTEKAVYKNVTFGFMDSEKNLLYSNGCFTKL